MHKEKGKVWLVGAGPGDPGLLTLRGRSVLEEAQVVVYDALVSPQILNMIPADAEKIFAGKRAGHHFLKQEETNRVLLEEAQKGKRVVRLKGGDPFLFGRGGEELELLSQNGIPFEIVPGITSAFAVPAYNGIPVTHRDYCSSVHVITGHKRQDQSYDIDFKALVRAGGTLVFLMGITALGDICSGLLMAGMHPDTPAAVLSRGTTARQTRISATLGTLAEACSNQKVITPAVIAVGDVCKLSERFSWYEKRPLAGIRILVTRPRELSSHLAELLRKEGAEVLEVPAIAVKPVENRETVDKAVNDLKAHCYDWVVFTSPSGVRIFLDQLLAEEDIRILAGVKIAVIGRGSEKALRTYGLKADFVPSVYDGETLGRELARICGEDSRILIPRAAVGSRELVEELEKCSHSVTDLATYDTVYTAPDTYDLGRLFADDEIDYVVFTSASTVRGFERAAAGVDFGRVQAVCIGKQTQAAAAGLGMKTVTSKEATLESLVQAVKDAAAIYPEKHEQTKAAGMRGE